MLEAIESGEAQIEVDGKQDKKLQEKLTRSLLEEDEQTHNTDIQTYTRKRRQGK